MYMFLFCVSDAFVTIEIFSRLPVKGCKFAYARHKNHSQMILFLACQTYCDTGHPLLWSSSGELLTYRSFAERFAMKLS